MESQSSLIPALRANSALKSISLLAKGSDQASKSKVDSKWRSDTTLKIFVWLHTAAWLCWYPAGLSNLAEGAAGAAIFTHSLLLCRPVCCWTQPMTLLVL